MRELDNSFGFFACGQLIEQVVGSVVVYRKMGIWDLVLDEMFPLEEGMGMRSVQLLYILQWLCFFVCSSEEMVLSNNGNFVGVCV